MSIQQSEPNKRVNVTSISNTAQVPHVILSRRIGNSSRVFTVIHLQGSIPNWSTTKLCHTICTHHTYTGVLHTHYQYLRTMVYAHVVTFQGNMYATHNVTKYKDSLNLEDTIVHSPATFPCQHAGITCVTLTTTTHLHTSSQLLRALIKNAYN